MKCLDGCYGRGSDIKDLYVTGKSETISQAQKTIETLRMKE